jgi:beta-N-acetylhexosaminidase
MKTLRLAAVLSIALLACPLHPRNEIALSCSGAATAETYLAAEKAQATIADKTEEEPQLKKEDKPMEARDAAPAAMTPALAASHEEAIAWAEKTLAGLSLKQKIGQMICEQMRGDVVQDSSEFEKLLKLARESEIGAFVIYGGSPVETATVINRLQQESKFPLLMTIDFEGGPGQQLKGATEFPGNMALAAVGSEQLAYEVGKVGAEEGRACGFHVTYSPVVDVSTRPHYPASSVRSFGGDVELLGRMAAAYIRGYQENGMLTTAKHFPGRGDVDAIPGTSFTANNKPADQVVAEEFRAFKAAIDAGVTYVMTEHVAVPSVTGGSNRPASVEKELVTGWLKEKLGFNGIITSDDLWYPHVIERFGPVKVCVMAVQAGHDAVLKPADTVAAIDGLAAAVNAGDISEKQIDGSVKKILYWKARLNLHINRFVDLEKIPAVVACKKHTDVLNTLADSSLTLLVNRGFFPTDMSKFGKIVHISVQKNPKDANVAVIASKLTSAFPDVDHYALGAEGAALNSAEKVLDAAKTADLIVVSLLCQRGGPGDNAPINNDDLALLQQVIKAKPKATIVMSYGNPYFVEKLTNASAFVVGYGEAGWYGNQTIYADSFVRLLKGRITPKGRLPVAVSSETPIGSGIAY